MKKFKLGQPSQWTWRFYVAVGLTLLVINLFGPRGLLQWVLAEQQLGRLHADEVRLHNEVTHLETQIHTFKSSPFAKERAIRDVLGYLKKDEGSVEFIGADNSVNFAEQKDLPTDKKSKSGVAR